MTPLGSSAGAPRPSERGSVDIELPAEWAIDSMFGGWIAVVLADAAMIPFSSSAYDVVETLVRYLRPTRPGTGRVDFEIVSGGRTFATVECRLVCEQRVTAIAMVTLRARSDVPARPAVTREPPAVEVLRAQAGGLSSVVDWRSDSEWWADGPSDSEFRSWLSLRPSRAVEGPRLDLSSVRLLVAADLAGPALVRAGIPLPFRIATVSLSVCVVAPAVDAWVEQRIRVRSTLPDVMVDMELCDLNGALLATAKQRAVVAPASPEELPFSVTGFGWGRQREIPVLVEE